MLNKLLDEVYFDGLEKLVSDTAEKYPNFLKIMNGPSREFPIQLVRCLSLPESVSELHMFSFDSSSSVSEVIRWSNSNLELIKNHFLGAILDSFRDKNVSISAETLKEFRYIENSTDINVLREYYIKISLEAERNKVSYDFSSESGLYWNELEEKMSWLGEELPDYIREKSWVRGLMKTGFKRSNVKDLDSNRLKGICSHLQLHELKTQMVSYAFSYMGRLKKEELHKNQWILKEKNLDKIAELIINL